jgi:hypothetical protein
MVVTRAHLDENAGSCIRCGTATDRLSGKVIVLAPEGRRCVAWGRQPQVDRGEDSFSPRRGDGHCRPFGAPDLVLTIPPGADAPGYTPPPLRGEKRLSG